MSKESLALEWISKHLGHPITRDDLAYESYVFEFEELDDSLLPADYASLFQPNQSVLTSLYVVNDVMVYFIEPIGNLSLPLSLIGLIVDSQLMQYQIQKEDYNV